MLRQNADKASSSHADAARLRGLLAARAADAQDQNYLQELAAELERAHVLEQDEVPPDVITMHSRANVLGR